MSLNLWILAIFAPVLILVGILGFVLPKEKALTSGAPAYNVFHIIAGLVGLAIFFFVGDDRSARTFNTAFGVIDLYQAVASFAGIFPIRQFQWKGADDVLHVVTGVALVAVGLFA